MAVRSFSFAPMDLTQEGIVCNNMVTERGNIAVVNSVKPLCYCVPHGSRIGYWKLKKLK